MNNKNNTIVRAFVMWGTIFSGVCGGAFVVAALCGEVRLTVGYLAAITGIFLASAGRELFWLLGQGRGRDEFWIADSFAEFLQVIVGGVSIVMGVVGAGLFLSCIWWGGPWLPIVSLCMMATGPVAFAAGLIVNIKDKFHDWKESKEKRQALDVFGNPD